MQYNLRALQIFECVARTGSIAAATKELNISSSAISHQLRKITEQVGEKLIERSGRQLTLSKSGKRLASSLGLAFEQLDESIESVVGKETTTIRIAMCSTFGCGWIIKRLPALRARHPDIQVQLMMHSDDPLNTEIAADAFVTVFPPRDGYWTLKLFDQRLIAVAGRDMTPAASLSTTTFITTKLERGALASDWQSYFSAHGDPQLVLEKSQLIQCSHKVFALEAARQGIGVALIPDFLAEEDLRNGTLVKWSDASIMYGPSYYFCMKSARRYTPITEAVARWIQQERSSYLSANGDSATE